MNDKEIRVLTFSPPFYNKSVFYSFMGPYFGDRIWKKQLPHLNNSNHKFWWVFIIDSLVVGFGAIEKSYRGIEIDIVFSEDFTLWKRINKILVRKSKKLFGHQSDIFVDLLKACGRVDFYVDNGFEIYKETKNYYFLVNKADK